MTQPPISLVEELKNALDFFFRRRPPLAALMWHTENKAANSTFVVPQGKIYEVYAKTSAANSLYLNDGTLNSTPIAGLWYPINVGAFGYGSEYGITGEIGTAGSGDTNLNMLLATGATGYRTSTCPQGWILSENDVLTSASAFVVRWRDVTHRQ